MKWNAFNLISPTIEKTKQRLFPFNFKDWIKLTIISFIASTGKNFNISNSGGSIPNSSTSDVNVSEKIRESIRKYWPIGGITLTFGFILMTIWSYIQSVFSFIFIDSLIKKESKFTFKKNQSKGISLFLFKFIITIITIILLGALIFPYAYHFMKANPIVNSVGIGYIILSILIPIFYFLALWFFIFLFLNDFTIPYMYAKNTPAFFSLKIIWKEILKNKLEVFIYWLARIVLGILIGIIGIIAVLILGLITLIIAGILFLIGFLIYKIITGTIILTILIILGAIIGLALFLLFLITLSALLLPLTVFSRYFALINFEKLTKIKILKKLK